MENIKIVAFVGMPGAGKSVCAEYMADKGLPLVYFGGITIEEVKARGLDVNEANEKTVREDLRATEGKDVYANRILAQIDQLIAQGQQKIVVDGLYTWSEYKVFKQRFGERVIVISVAAPRHVRHQRLAHRPVRPLTEEEVTAREYAEIENMEKGGPIANADYTIVNDKQTEHLLEELEVVLKQVNF